MSCHQPGPGALHPLRPSDQRSGYGYPLGYRYPLPCGPAIFGVAGLVVAQAEP